MIKKNIDKIKTCPFCGSCNISFSEIYNPANGRAKISVQCLDCDAQGPPRVGKRQAVEYWNIRFELL